MSEAQKAVWERYVAAWSAESVSENSGYSRAVWRLIVCTQTR
jgi:hypothetical protein